VALKMILEGRLASAEAVGRFRQEARAAAGLDHPGIVPVYEVGECEGHHFFTMAFIEGSTLSSMVDKRGPLPADEAAGIVKAIAGAIDYAHRRGIIHRDLKPSNILIDGDGRPRVTDFGLAKSLGDVGGLTSPGQVLGTPSFMAPEQAMGNNQQVGPAADIYALGGVLYFCLTGRPPFSSDSIMDLLQQVVYEPPAAPHKLRPNIPQVLEDICLKCLQKEPSRRPGSAAEVVAALEPWCAAESVAAAAPARRRRGGLIIWAAAGVIVGLLVAGGVWAVRNRSANVSTGPKTANTEVQQKAAEAREKAFTPVEATHHDFSVHVEMLGARRDESGELRLVEGNRVRFQIKADRNAYVGIWNVPPEGPILQVFPNKWEPDNRVKAGQLREVPGMQKYTIDAELSRGVEQVWVVASTVAWDPIQGQQEGPYVVFKTPAEREGWKNRLREIRGFRLRPTEKGTPAVAEEILRYRVVAPARPGGS
jgi:hypothetical protein